MPLLTMLIFGIGPSVAKALLKSVLKDHPLIGDIAPDLLDMLRDSAKGERTRREDSGHIAAIGASVATRLRPLFDDAVLTDAERATVLREVLLTLDQTDAEQMIESRVDPRRLREALLASRPDATKTLSAREKDLYQRAVGEAAPALTAIAAELCGYDSLRDAALLQGQDDSAERDQRILVAIEALLHKPDAAGARFEQLYREAIKDKLDKLELFGVRRLTAAMKRQHLNVAYVTVEVDRGSARGPGDDTKHALRQALAEAVRSQPATGDQREQSGPIDEVLASERRIVVRGDPGSGKTTLLQWIAVNTAAQRFGGALSLWNNVIPFFIRLRDVAIHSFPAPEEYIVRVEPDIAGRRPSDDWEHLQLDNGRAVLLIDGVDELPSGKREAFLERLQSLLRLYPNARYIITSRPAAVSQTNWPEWYEWVREHGFAEVAIKEMSPTATARFIDQWHRAYEGQSDDADERAELRSAPANLKRLLEQRPSLRRLAANPLLCAMICALHLERRNNLPTERIKLYEECIDMLMEQRDVGRSVSQEDYPALGTAQRLALLQDLAYRMMRNGEIEIAAETATEQFELFLPRLGLDGTRPERMLAYFVERAGLLREPVEGQIDFRHRTFQEFFTAQEIAAKAEVGYLLSKAGDETWRETIALAAGKLRPTDCEKLLRGLLYGKLRAPKPGDSPRVATTPPGHRALALACLETAVNIEPALRPEVFEGAKALFPPYTAEQQRLVAAAGEHAIAYLAADRQPNIAAGAACIDALALIGGEKALAAIERYLAIEHEVIEEAIDNAWPNFDYQRFAARLLQTRVRVDVSNPALLPALRELPQLQRLSLSGMQVSDLSVLAQLPQLQRLSLSNTPVTDLSVLAQLPQLQQLSLSFTTMTDLSVLAQLPQLQRLFLSGIQVTDLSVLAQLPQLQQLSLFNTPVTDLSVLAQLPQLQQLSLSFSQVTDLSVLAQLPQLQQLSLSNTPVSDLSVLNQLPQLQQLSLSNTPVSDLSVLNQLPQLQQLSLSAQVTDLSVLVQLPQLQRLSLNNISVLDLSMLNQLPQLQQLSLSFSQVTDLSVLARLPQLQQLFLFNRQMTDLSVLAQLPQLQQLYLSETPVTDLSVLARLSQLQQLYLFNVQVTDLSVLAQLPNLERLFLL